MNNNYNFHIQKNKIYSIEIDLLSVYNYEAHMMRISICSEPDIEKRKRVNQIAAPNNNQHAAPLRLTNVHKFQSVSIQTVQVRYCNHAW